MTKRIYAKYIPDVMHSVRNRALQGNMDAAKLFLNVNEMGVDDTPKFINNIQVSADDVNVFIEDLRNKVLGLLGQSSDLIQRYVANFYANQGWKSTRFSNQDIGVRRRPCLVSLRRQLSHSRRALDSSTRPFEECSLPALPHGPCSRKLA